MKNRWRPAAIALMVLAAALLTLDGLLLWQRRAADTPPEPPETDHVSVSAPAELPGYPFGALALADVVSVTPTIEQTERKPLDEEDKESFLKIIRELRAWEEVSEEEAVSRGGKGCGINFSYTIT